MAIELKVESFRFTEGADPTDASASKDAMESFNTNLLVRLGQDTVVTGDSMGQWTVRVEPYAAEGQ